MKRQCLRYILISQIGSERTNQLTAINGRHIQLQRMESDLFIKSVYSPDGLKLWSVPVHDSLLVKKEDAEAVRQFLQ